MSTLALASDDAAELFEALQLRDETAWTLVARVARSGELLLGRRLHRVDAQHYIERSPRRLQIRSSGWVPAFRDARGEDAVPIFVHTHPGGRPEPSLLDDEVDRELDAYARQRGLRGYGALIVGGTFDSPTLQGHWSTADGKRYPIDRVRVAGRKFRLHLSQDPGARAAPQLLDRQVRAFGEDGQLLLSQLRVGVVGAGGTGSATIEQLARLGVGEIIVIDPDVLEDTNLSRVHQSSARDVGLPKAELAAREAAGFGTGAAITPLVESATSLTGLEALNRCDVVFGCTDDHAGRLVLSRLAYRYLIPVVDTAVIIDVADDRIRGVVGRVTVVAPGEPCLLCRGQVDHRLAAEEMMNPAERKQRAGEGYARGEAGPAPAVVAYTTATSAHAINEMLARLLGFAASDSSQILIQFDSQTIRRSGRPAQAGHYCAGREEWGLGDTAPPLGIAGLA